MGFLHFAPYARYRRLAQRTCQEKSLANASYSVDTLCYKAYTVAMSDPNRKGVAPLDHTFERARRCQNCVSFATGELSRQQWRVCRARDLAVIASTGPMPRLGDMELPMPSGQDARLNNIRQMDALIASDMAGLCMKGARPKNLGGPEGDFVHAKFFCDRWTGRDGASLVTSGFDDKLNEELAEIVEDRAKKKS